MCYGCDEYEYDDGDIYYDGDFIYCDECGAPLEEFDGVWWCDYCSNAPDPSPLDINEMLGSFDPIDKQEDYYESGAYYDDLPELPQQYDDPTDPNYIPF